MLSGKGRKVVPVLMSVSMLAAVGTVPEVESVKAAEDPVEIRIFSEFSSADEPEMSKYMVEQMEKELNIKLVRDEVPSSSYNEKLQLALTDGDYPDVIVFNSTSDSLFLDSIDNGLTIPLNDYLEPGKYPNFDKYVYEDAWTAVQVKNDGNVYMIPRCTVARQDGFVVRKDWLDNLGIEIDSENYTVTKDQFKEIIKAFCESDPDGDGEKNTYGFVMYPGSSFMLVGKGAFDCVGWEKSDGDYEYMMPDLEIGNEKFKELLKFNQEVYQYAHPDFLVANVDDLWTGEQVGMMQCFAGHIDTMKLPNVQAVDPDAEAAYISGIVNDEGVLQGETQPGVWGGLAITKNCEHPEKVLEMVDWLLGDEGWEYAMYGIPDVMYKKNADGTCTITDKEAYKKDKATGAVWSTKIARRKECADFFIDQTLPEEDYKRVKSWIDSAISACVFSPLAGKVPEISTDTVFSEAENDRENAITKIITGAMDVDEYDQVLADWYEKGGKTYVEQANEIIKQNQAAGE